MRILLFFFFFITIDGVFFLILSSQNTLSRKEAAALLGVSTRTLDRYVKKKIITSHRRGRHTVFVREDVEALLTEPTPSASHVVSPSSKETLPGTPQPDITAFATLIAEMNEQIQQKDAHIAKLHYELGQLQEREKNSVPLLEMRNEKRENAKKVQEAIEEARRAKTGRFFFFILFVLTLALAGLFANMLFFA